ncbi:MAG: heme exporter protein CcmB [Euryarchaeota archaeon]|nr:heme exporter protein CcmB [Euryarchaeota archaeon]
MLGNLAWEQSDRPERVAAGVLWISFTFAGMLTLSRSLHRERDRGTWEALALLPVDWGTIYFAKVAANAVILLLVETIVLPLYAVFFNYDLVTPLPKLIPVLLLGTIGFCAAGTLLSALSSHARAREILLPILLMPLLVPLLMMTLQATHKILLGFPSSELLAEHELLVAFDAIFLAIGWLTFDYVLGE